MAQEVPRKRIQKFKQDVDFLLGKGMTLNDIAEKMGMASTNFSSYYNESIPITTQFLGKFYDAWIAEIEPEGDEDFVRDVAEIYRIHDIIVEKLVDGQNRLINSNVALIEYNQKLMDILLVNGFRPETPSKNTSEQ